MILFGPPRNHGGFWVDPTTLEKTMVICKKHPRVLEQSANTARRISHLDPPKIEGFGLWMSIF